MKVDTWCHAAYKLGDQAAQPHLWSWVPQIAGGHCQRVCDLVFPRTCGPPPPKLPLLSGCFLSPSACVALSLAVGVKCRDWMSRRRGEGKPSLQSRWQGMSQLRVLVAVEPQGGSEQLSGPVIICKVRSLPQSLLPCSMVMRCQ